MQRSFFKRRRASDPVAAEPTPGAAEPTPGAAEPMPGAAEPMPGAVEPTPGTVEPTPGAEAPADPAPPVPSLAVVGAEATARLRTLDDLPGLLAEPAATSRARRLTLRVEAYHRPWPRWVGRVGSMPGLLSVSVDLPEEEGPATVVLSAVGPRPVHVFLVSAARALAPQAPLPLAMSPRIAVANPVLSDDPAVRWLPHPRVAGGRREENWATATEVLLTRPSGDPWSVDTVRFSPLGRTSPEPGSRVRRAPWSPALTAGPDGGRSAFAGLDVIDAAAGALAVPQTVQGLLRASACGVVVRLVEPGDGAGDAAGDAAGEGPAQVPEPVLASWRDDVDLSDSTRLYAASVRQRRAVHRHCSVQARLLGGLAADGQVLGADPTVSVLLATRRPENLAAMLAQIAAQDHPAVEVVLALHGDVWDDSIVDRGVARAREVRDLPVTVVRVPATLPLGAVLAAATLRACGTFVAKMDDDDGYAPQHLSDLVSAQRWSGAQVTGKPAEFMYLVDRDTTLRVRTVTETYGTFVAGGTLLIDRAALMASGGWRPIPRTVDRTLLRRMMDDGCLVYRTQGIGYTYVRGTGDHTFQTDEDTYLDRAVQEWPGRHDPA